ncbi:MAG: hypothetical protein HY866_06605 [Chloroflexi bacterium]|nr:hypothetical protein [Chloroflexota bacterium]
MLPYRLLFWIITLLAAVTKSDNGLLIQGPNCLHLYDDVQIQLNTHITRHIRTHSVSPDGKYLMRSIDYADYRELFVETVETGQRVTLQNYITMGYQIAWSPDSQFIYYTWADTQGKFHANLATTQGGFLGERQSDEHPRLMSFSPDSQYFVTSEPSVGVSLFTIHDNSHPLLTGPFDQWAYDDYRPSGQYWSPGGERLAYITESELVIMNAETRTLQQVLIPNPIPRIAHSTTVTIEWSPDGQRILIRYSNYDDQGAFALYLFEVTDRAINIIPIDFPDSTSPDLRQIRWVSPTELIYSKYIPTTPPPKLLEIKQYDVETQRNTIVLTRVEFDVFHRAHNFTFLHREGASIIVDVRSVNGFTPLFTRTFQTEHRLSCYWHDTSYAQFMICHILNTINSEYVTRIVTDDPNAPLWITTSATFAQANTIPLGHYTADGRFIIVGSTQGQDVKILDLKTHQVYPLPEEINRLVQNYPRFWGTVNVFPAPDDETWLLLLNSRLYRYKLAEDRWQAIPILQTGSDMSESPDSSQYAVHDVLWSPDSQRYAVLTYAADGTEYHASLFVNEADGRFRWSLGLFDHLLTSRQMHWTQCGDILAPIRDRLAAEKP